MFRYVRYLLRVGKLTIHWQPWALPQIYCDEMYLTSVVAQNPYARIKDEVGHLLFKEL